MKDDDDDDDDDDEGQDPAAGPGVGGILPYLSYIGMFRPKG